MIFSSKENSLTIILISIWTIVQSAFHLFWVIFAYLISMCRIPTTHYDAVFVYLTYFYKKSCGPIHLKKESLFFHRTSPDNHFSSNDSAEIILYKFIKDVLQHADLPERSTPVMRTELYLIILFIADVAWIATAVGLFVGVFWKFKQKYLSIIFYGPWLLCAAFVNFLDVVSSVQYGLDLIFIRSYTNWLQFIGVSNYNYFLSYNEHYSSSVVPAMPTTLVVSLLSRIFIVWIVNIVCFFFILFLAIPDLFYQQKMKPDSRIASSRGGKLRLNIGEDLDLSSSETRIRNWQIFYAAIEVNSTMTSSSAGTTSGSSSNKQSTDHKVGSDDKIVEMENENGVYINPAPEKEPLQQKDSGSSTDTGFRRFSDVASGITIPSTIDQNISKMPVIKGHGPCSYITPELQYDVVSRHTKQHYHDAKSHRRMVEIQHSSFCSTRF